MSNAASFLAIAALIAVTGCGKKGPPLPPLVRVPAAPTEFTAERRGDSVDLQFVVPSANTDNTRPANVERVDVYAVTAGEPFTDDQLMKQGAKVATVRVKAPKDPDRTIEEEESIADMEPPEGPGLDQGERAQVSEVLTDASLAPVRPKAERKSTNATPAALHDRPLLPPGPTPLTRTYLAVGVSTREQKGPPSRRLAVPLVPPPPAPNSPTIGYDETAISVTWNPVAGSVGVQRAAAADELPSRPIGVTPTAIAYNVYDTSAKPAPAKLTPAPLADPAFSDPRIVWNEERCYTVRAVATVAGMRIESAAPPPKCATPVDHFAPAAPVNLQSSPTEGAINLIWDPNSEKDLAGYIVLRGTSAASLQVVSSGLMQDTTFRDDVAPGVRFTYAVKAVDRAGNQSPASKTIEEAAR